MAGSGESLLSDGMPARGRRFWHARARTGFKGKGKIPPNPPLEKGGINTYIRKGGIRIEVVRFPALRAFTREWQFLERREALGLPPPCGCFAALRLLYGAEVSRRKFFVGKNKEGQYGQGAGHDQGQAVFAGSACPSW